MLTTWQRRLYAVALVSVPVLTALEGTLTYFARGGAGQPDAETGTPEMLAPIAAHHRLWMAGAFAGLLFAVLLLPAYLALVRVTRPHAPRLAAIGGALALVGVPAAGMYTVTWDFVIGAMAGPPVPPGTAALADGIEAYPPFGFVFLYPYLASLGVVLLAVGMFRARVVPRWAAVAVAVFPLNEIVGVGDGWPYLLVCAVWLAGLTAVARSLPEVVPAGTAQPVPA